MDCAYLLVRRESRPHLELGAQIFNSALWGLRAGGRLLSGDPGRFLFADAGSQHTTPSDS